jgi:hypothetical protein
MRPEAIRIAALAACVIAAACGQPERPAVLLTTSSWDVVLTVTSAGPSTPFGLPVSCPPVAFTMHLDPDGSERLKATLGRDGQVMVGSLVENGDSYGLGADMADIALPSPGGCGSQGFSMTQLALRGTDANGDRIAEALSGSGAGSGLDVVGDQGYAFPFTFELSGTPDVTAPHLLVPADVLNPLDVVSLPASEPLALASQLNLEGTTSVSLDAEASPQGIPGVSSAAVAGFTTSHILPFSGSWSIVGNAPDLAGLPLDPPAPVTTLADPGLFAEDGFEGAALAAATTGDVRVVTGVGALPALSGTQSLFAAPGASVTLHLARPAGTWTVRFAARALAPAPASSSASPQYDSVPSVRAGVVGGTSRPYATSVAAGDAAATGDPTWVSAGPLGDVTIPIDEVGDDIVVRIAPRSSNGCVGLCPPPAPAWLIDDLRIE